MTQSHAAVILFSVGATVRQYSIVNPDRPDFYALIQRATLEEISTTDVPPQPNARVFQRTHSCAQSDLYEHAANAVSRISQIITLRQKGASACPTSRERNQEAPLGSETTMSGLQIIREAVASRSNVHAILGGDCGVGIDLLEAFAHARANLSADNIDKWVAGVWNGHIGYNHEADALQP
jgi:hypothetical protein